MDLETRGGDNPFTVLTLGNAAGQIQTAPFWASDRHRLAGITKGNVVLVSGTVRSYREQRQVAVDSIRILPKEQIEWRALMPSVGDVAQYWDPIERWRRQLSGPRLARVLDLFYDDPEFRARFEQCPASTGGHHAQLGGLLKHTYEVARIAMSTASLFDSVDTELVLAGALLHDIGKLDSYRWNGAFEMTVPGTVIGHVVLGVLMLEHRVRAVSPMPCSDAELLLLEHLILSHHGKLEFGAPVPPLTLEAEILHYADNASAKAAAMESALQASDHFPGDSPISTRGLWQVDHRRVWRCRSDWGRAQSHHE